LKRDRPLWLLQLESRSPVSRICVW
jgi:hypothetical protein